MTLDAGDIIWEFDGRDGRDRGLVSMIGFYIQHLEGLLPAPSDDPFEQIVADLADDPTNRMLESPRLARLFPAALTDEKEADDFWRDSIHNQTRARIEAAQVVVDNLNQFAGFVPVRLGDADHWIKTLGAIRLFWYAEVAGSERLAEPATAIVRANPGIMDLIEWLGYMLEDLLESRATCLRVGASLDPMGYDYDDDEDADDV